MSRLFKTLDFIAIKFEASVKLQTVVRAYSDPAGHRSHPSFVSKLFKSHIIININEVKHSIAINLIHLICSANELVY